jgi:3-dehydroquinate dehydratase-1
MMPAKLTNRANGANSTDSSLNVFPVCVSIGEGSCAEVKSTVERFEFSEIRLDLCRLTLEEIGEVFSSGKTLIATCREGVYGRDERLDRLLTAIRAGATFVDVETETDEPFRRAVAEHAKRYGCRLIVSHHDFEKTPPVEEMLLAIRKCRKQGADTVKFVSTANDRRDSARILSLYALCTDIPLVAFAMGKTGRVTRLACVPLGAPFTYAAVSDDRAVAGGQMSFDTMKTFITLHKLY